MGLSKAYFHGRVWISIAISSNGNTDRGLPGSLQAQKSSEGNRKKSCEQRYVAYGLQARPKFSLSLRVAFHDPERKALELSTDACVT